MTPIRVMHLITNLEIGGAQIMLARLVRAADPRRFRMTVVSLMELGPVATQLTAHGITVRSLGMKRGVPDPRGLVRLLKILRSAPVDLLHTWLYHADLLGTVAARIARVPRLAWNVQCSNMDLSRYSLLSAVLPRMLVALSRQPDLVVVNSNAGLAAHERLGYRPRHWQFVPNGVDIDLFHPNSAARSRLCDELGLPSQSFIICLPARFDPMKDQATFVAAAARFAAGNQDARFILVGHRNDPTNSGLRRLIESFQIVDKVHLLGERHDIEWIFGGVDVVTLSSAFGEGSPNVLAEAMACGVPVVTTDVGDAALIVGQEGTVVPPRDPDAIAQGWEKLYQIGGERRAALGLAGRERILRDYALPVIVGQYERIYEALVE